MAINIKNREAEQLLEELSARSGKGKSQLVLELLRREAARQSRVGEAASRRRRIQALARRFSRKASGQRKTPEEIVGYGDDGLPR